VVSRPDDEPSAERLLNLDVRRTPEALVLSVRGEIDALTTDRFRAAVSECLVEADDLVVVDLVEVSFLGSHGLAALVSAAQESERSRYKPPIRLVVDNNRPVVRPIELTGLDQYLALYDSVDEALSV
jgi:anti-sigma B factor antagonist